MVSSHSHDDSKVSLEDVGSFVEVSAPVFGVDVVPVVRGLSPNPSNASNRPRAVEAVFGLRNGTKVRDSIVIAATINVVKKVRLITMKKEPTNSVGFVNNALVSNDSVTVAGVNVSSDPSFESKGFVRPSQIARFWVIAKDIADGVWNNSMSHIKPHFDLVRGLTVAAVSASIISGCATERGNIRHAEHARAQIEMVQVQRQASIQEAQMESATNTALVDALARVAEANPQHAPSVAVALAVIGVRSQDGSDDDAPLVTLQRQQNDALEYVKVLATPILNTATALGVAAITADVQKNASDNAAKVQINDALQDAAIVGSITDLGIAATNQVGIEVTGDYYDLQDTATIDQSSSADTDASIDYTLTDEAFVNLGTINESSGNTSGDTDSNNTSGDTNTDSQNDNSVDSSDNSDNTDNSVTDVVP